MKIKTEKMVLESDLNDLKEKIMQTSFKESGAVEKSSEDEDNVLK